MRRGKLRYRWVVVFESKYSVRCALFGIGFEDTFAFTDCFVFVFVLFVSLLAVDYIPVNRWHEIFGEASQSLRFFSSATVW